MPGSLQHPFPAERLTRPMLQDPSSLGPELQVTIYSWQPWGTVRQRSPQPKAGPPALFSEAPSVSAARVLEETTCGDLS